MPEPRVFISYAWEDEDHQSWVRSFADWLEASGVSVTLDQWQLVPGDQIPHFMERAIRENDFVLIVCTPRYRERSDSRAGGVGYEGDIMTAEVVAAGNHRKFIPILKEASWAESAPAWLSGKLYVDLSRDQTRFSQQSQLLAALFGHPAHFQKYDSGLPAPFRPNVAVTAADAMQCGICRVWLEYGAKVCRACQADISYKSDRWVSLKYGIVVSLPAALFLPQIAFLRSDSYSVWVPASVLAALFVIVVVVSRFMSDEVKPRFSKKRHGK